MTDIWPCRGPWPVSWAACAEAAANAGFNRTQSIVMAAIAEADGGLDLAVINDTPVTGDYSVGTWQVNYYNGLYQARTAMFGTPCQLIASGVQGQANAARRIWLAQGFQAWGAYNNGSYARFLHGNVPPAAESLTEPGLAPPAPAPDWSVYVWHGAADNIVTARRVNSFRGGIRKQ